MADVKVACLGLAFKPDIDDLRESPAVEITQNVAELGCQVLAVEPNIETLPSKLAICNLKLTPQEDAVAKADVVCVLVKHRPFIEAVADIKQHPRAIDAVGLFA